MTTKKCIYKPKTALISAVLLLSALLFLCGCDSLLNDGKSSSSAEPTASSLSLSVSFPGFPSAAQSADSAIRSAHPSSGNLKNLTVTAELSGISSESTGVPDTTPGKYIFSFPNLVKDTQTTYTLKINVKNGSTSIATGETNVTVAANTASADATVVLSPVTEGTNVPKGKVELKIKIDDKLIGKIKYFDYKTGNTNFIPFAMDLSMLTTGEITISSDRIGAISAGTYQLEMKFSSDSSHTNIFYIRTETVNVWPEMTTDTWYFADSGTTSKTLLITPAMINRTFYVRGNKIDTSTETWYEKNLSSAATASDGNDGSMMKPFATLQKAVDTITAINDGTSSYTIFVDGLLKPAASSITNPAIAYYKQNTNLSLVIQGLGTDRSKNIIDAGNVSKRQILSFNYDTASATNINVTVKNLCLTNANCTEQLTSDETYGGAVNGSANYVFDNVHAYNNKAKYGGVIYSAGNVTLQNGTVFGNKDATSSATNSDYSNYAKYNGGAIRMADGTLTIKKGCYVSYNYCQGDSSTNNAGGGISIQGKGTLVLEEGAYIQYNCCDTYGGGGVYLQTANSSAQIYGTITGNSTGANGGGIYVNKGTVTIYGTVSNNKATENGGGIFMQSANCTVNSAACINYNSAGGQGGAICQSSGSSFLSLNINGGTISGNTAVKNGGAISCIYAVISGGTITGNSTGENGGGVYVAAGTTTIAGTVSGNKATSGNGGGVYVNRGTLTLENTGVIGKSDAISAATYGNCSNSAKNGGGVYVAENGTATISGKVFYNYASTNGGGVFIATGSSTEATITGTLSYNSASSSGKGVYNATTLTMKGAACITSDNDVYLPNYKTITIGGALTGTNVATITPENYAEGTTTVLSLATSTNPTTTLAAECTKFAVTPYPDGTAWKVDTDGRLQKKQP